MHPSAYQFVVKALVSEGVRGKDVVEIGSLDVNASTQGLSVRALCDGASSYYGIDARDGPGVDAAISAAAYDGRGAYDIAITTEALEHCPEPETIIDCARRALKPGGLLIITAAGPLRTPHGCDGGAVGEEFYQNVDPAALRRWLADWDAVTIEENTDAHDVYAIARKPR